MAGDADADPLSSQAQNEDDANNEQANDVNDSGESIGRLGLAAALKRPAATANRPAMSAAAKKKRHNIRWEVLGVAATFKFIGRPVRNRFPALATQCEILLAS